MCWVTPLKLEEPLVNPWDCLLIAMTNSGKGTEARHDSSEAYLDTGKLVRALAPWHFRAATS